MLTRCLLLQTVERQVTRVDGSSFARRHACLFAEASAKTGDAVQQAFKELVDQCVDSTSLGLDRASPSLALQLAQEQPAKKRWGCC